MTLDTDTLVKEIKSRFDHATQKRLLKEKYFSKMTFAYEGGMWRASPEMITFLSLYGEETIVILDLYETPVKVHAGNLCVAMKQRWQEQMNAWLIELESLGQNR